MNALLRLANTLLLAAILSILILIWRDRGKPVVVSGVETPVTVQGQGYHGGLNTAVPVYIEEDETRR